MALNFGQTIADIGHAFGLPELGVSERITGSNRDLPSGFVSPVPQSQLLPVSNFRTPAVLGATSTDGFSQQVPASFDTTTQQAPSAPVNTSGGGGGAPVGNPTQQRIQELEGINRNPAQETELQQLRNSLTAGQDQVNQEIQNIFDESSRYLNQAEAGLRADLPSVLQEAERNFLTNQGLLQSQRAGAEQQLSDQEQQALSRREDALSSARRLYNELQRQGLQRFGGSTSAGQAFSEISAAEQQRNAASISRDFGTAMREIEGARNQVLREYDNGIMQLTQQKQSAISGANRDFQNKLLEINRLRADVGVNKAEMRLSALQDLRNQIFQVELQNQQFQQQLAAQRQAAEIELASRAQSLQQQVGMGQSGLESLFANTTLNPQTGVVVGGQGGPQQGGMVGAIDPRFRQFFDKEGNQIASF